MRIFAVTTMAAALLAGAASAQEDWRAQALDALPDSGEMHLQFIVNDQPDGFMRLGWSKDEEAGLLRYYDRTMFASQEVYETLSASVDLETFSPASISIRFHQGPAIMSVDGAAQDGVMAGERSLYQPLGGEQRAELNVAITDDMISRGTVFFLAQSLPLNAGESISFDWFAAMNNSSATITVTAFDAGVIETISGEHAVLRLEVRGGAPENDIYVTNNEGLRQVVRIDVLGQPMRFEAIPEPEAE